MRSIPTDAEGRSLVFRAADIKARFWLNKTALAEYKTLTTVVLCLRAFPRKKSFWRPACPGRRSISGSSTWSGKRRTDKWHVVKIACALLAEFGKDKTERVGG